MSATGDHFQGVGYWDNRAAYFGGRPACKECGNPDDDCCCDLCPRCERMKLADTDGICTECLTEHAQHLADVRSGR